MTEQYTEERLAKIEKDILSGIDKEKQEEKEFDDIAMDIASNCLSSNNHSYKYEYLGTEYIWEVFADTSRYNRETGKIELGFTIVCTDTVKMNIGNGKYIPLTAFAPYEDKRVERKMLAATIIKSVLKHKAGKDIVVEDM